MKNIEPLRVKIEDGQLVITIGVLALGTAILAGSAIEDSLVIFGEERAEITDSNVFAQAIAAELIREDEEGSTLVHMMLDDAARIAIEDGCEGIKIPGDDP